MRLSRKSSRNEGPRELPDGARQYLVQMNWLWSFFSELITFDYIRKGRSHRYRVEWAINVYDVANESGIADPFRLLEMERIFYILLGILMI